MFKWKVTEAFCLLYKTSHRPFLEWKIWKENTQKTHEMISRGCWWHLLTALGWIANGSFKDLNIWSADSELKSFLFASFQNPLNVFACRYGGKIYYYNFCDITYLHITKSGRWTSKCVHLPEVQRSGTCLASTICFSSTGHIKAISPRIAKETAIFINNIISKAPATSIW